MSDPEPSSGRVFDEFTIMLNLRLDRNRVSKGNSVIPLWDWDRILDLTDGEEASVSDITMTSTSEVDDQGNVVKETVYEVVTGFSYLSDNDPVGNGVEEESDHLEQIVWVKESGPISSN